MPNASSALLNSLPCTAGPLAGTTLKLRPWQTAFYQCRLQDRQSRQSCGSHGRAFRGPQERQNATRCRPLPVRLVWSRTEPRGECYSVACTRDQAKRVFDEMVAIITRMPWLEQAHQHRAFSPRAGGHGRRLDVPRAVGGCCAGSSGSPVVRLLRRTGQVPNRALYDALGTALGGRAQPLMLVISTQAATDMRRCRNLSITV